MSRVAQYIVIDDPNFGVGGGGSASGGSSPSPGLWTEFDFQVPSNCYLNHPSVLTWMLDFKMNDNDSFLEVLINGISVYSATYVNNRYQPVQEVINPNILLWGKNMITFRCNSTASAAFTPIISDVVLWIEVSV